MLNENRGQKGEARRSSTRTSPARCLEDDFARTRGDVSRRLGADHGELLGSSLGLEPGETDLDPALGCTNGDVSAVNGLEQLLGSLGLEGLACVLVDLGVALDRPRADTSNLGGCSRRGRALGVTIPATLGRGRPSPGVAVDPKQLVRRRDPPALAEVAGRAESLLRVEQRRFVAARVVLGYELDEGRDQILAFGLLPQLEGDRVAVAASRICPS